MPSHKITITKSVSKPVTKSKMLSFLIPVLGILITVLLVYMVWDLATRPNSSTTEEGFIAKSKSVNKSGNSLGKLKSLRKMKKGQNSKKRSPSQSKLSEMKNGKYNPNDDLKDYGMDGDPSKKDDIDDTILQNDSKLEKHLAKMGSEFGKDALDKLMANRASGKRDNFKNVINEVDNINPGAFDLTSIGGTIRRYNENFNNRLNYAKAKNEGDNLEATMAQGKVIFDEFKKIFLFTDMFS